MKTLILFATKYGATAVIAQKIADKIQGAALHNLKTKGLPSVADYDCVIIGSSVYAGRIRKEARVFLSKNKNLLVEKKLGFFVSGIGASGGDKFLKDNFPADLLQNARAAAFLGGIFDPQKAGSFERFIIKIITKSSACINIIDDKKIEEFADAMMR